MLCTKVKYNCASGKHPLHQYYTHFHYQQRACQQRGKRQMYCAHCNETCGRKHNADKRWLIWAPPRRVCLCKFANPAAEWTPGEWADPRVHCGLILYRAARTPSVAAQTQWPSTLSICIFLLLYGQPVLPELWVCGAIKGHQKNALPTTQDTHKTTRFIHIQASRYSINIATALNASLVCK